MLTIEYFLLYLLRVLEKHYIVCVVSMIELF